MRRLFTPEQVKCLSGNPNVYAVTETEIRYTNAFKCHFVEQYLAGNGPGQIFAEAGMPADLIGYKRIERACYRWKRAFENGTLALEGEQLCRTGEKKALMSIISEQQQQIAQLQKELAARCSAE